MDIGSGFGGDDRQRYLRIALVAGVVLVILLLVLIVVAIVNNRRGGADPTATAPARTATRPAIVASPSTSTRPTVAVSVAPSTAPSVAPSTAPATSAAPSASAGKAFVVANTGGEGVRLRAEPTTTAQEIAVLPDGHRMIEVGPGRNSDGRDWLNVEDENGNRGWVAAEFATAAP